MMSIPKVLSASLHSTQTYILAKKFLLRKGIWRKCTLESFRAGSPNWSTVIDIDALPPPTLDTAKTWVWHGSILLDDGPGQSQA